MSTKENRIYKWTLIVLWSTLAFGFLFLISGCASTCKPQPLDCAPMIRATLGLGQMVTRDKLAEMIRADLAECEAENKKIQESFGQ